MSKLSYPAAVALIVPLLTRSALGQQVVEPFNKHDSQGWEFLISTGIEYEPAYTGSNVSTVEPGFDFKANYTTRSGNELFVSLGEIGATWLLGHSSQISTILEYEFGRDNTDDPVLEAFPEIDDTVEAQAIFQQQLGSVVVGIGAQYDILDRGKGLVGFLGLANRRKLTRGLLLHAQLDLSFADAEHMQTEVGIGPETAAATGLNTYRPVSGYKGITAQLGLEYAYSKSWTLMTDLSIERYGSIMSNSPLISELGTETNVEVEIAVAYKF